MRRMISGCGLVLCAAGLVASVNGQVTQEPFVTGIDRPVFLTHAPGEPDKLFVLEQEGAIRVIENGVLRSTPFLDIDPVVTGGASGQDERGLLGLAFSPDYETDGRFFVYYTGTRSTGGFGAIVASYQRDDSDSSGNTADATSEDRILEFSQPFSNHNGGWLGFGPDGFLYISTGDGGSGNDPQNNSSRLVNLLGKMLRIDVSGGTGYTVPADNPFATVGDNVQPEIWSYGLRNPWRTSFDSETGDLWIADVGQNAREEVNFQPASSAGGEHYGWRCREGFIATPGIGGCPSDTSIYTDPVYDYTDGCSVIGGYVYRGCAIPELQGMYIFGDYCSGDVEALDPASPSSPELLFDFGFGLSAFGEDQEGELYVMDVLAGFINKVVPTNPVDANGDGVIDSCEAPCAADVNGDGELNPADFNAWVIAFNAGAAECDQNGDGACNPADFNAWVINFNAGC
ncbi:MAG: PQQ-dependent sugar dehydrogenase [Planctomycetota bacterium]